MLFALTTIPPALADVGVPAAILSEEITPRTPPVAERPVPLNPAVSSEKANARYMMILIIRIWEFINQKRELPKKKLTTTLT